MKNSILMLSAIIVLGMAVRIIGIEFGLPFIFHNDEPIIVNYALSYGAGDLNPHFFRLPPLLSYILFFAYGIFYIIGKLFGIFSNVREFGFLYLNNPTPFYLIGRFLLGVLPGTFSIYLIYKFARESFSKFTGFLSALFLSLNFLHVRNSHYIYFDIALTAAIIGYFIVSYRLFVCEKLRFYFYSGLILAIGTSIKYSAVIFAFITVMIVLLNTFWFRKYSFKDFLKKMSIFGASFILFIFLSNPFMFLDFETFYRHISRLALFPLGFWFIFKVSTLGTFGAWMTGAALLGIIAAIARRNIFHIILISALFIYYLVLAKSSQGASRYILPIVPIILVFAANFIDHITSYIRRKGMRFIAALFLSLLLMFYGCLKVYYVDKLFLRKDTRTLAYEWVISNIAPGEKVALDATGSVHPMLKKTKKQIEDSFKGFTNRKLTKPKGVMEYKVKAMLDNPEYNDNEAYEVYYLRHGPTKKNRFLSIYPVINIDMEQIKERSIKYVILTTMLDPRQGYEKFIDDLNKNSTFVKKFSPYKNGIERIVPLESVNEPAAAFSLKELRDRERFGPVVRIYKL